MEEQIENALWGAGSILSERVTLRLVREYPYQSMSVIGGVTWLLASAYMVKRVYRRFFDTFDPRVLRPVGRPRGIAFEGLGDSEALSWIKPEKGARKAAWNELHRWVLAGVTENEAFGWRVLLGRPGAGKTRTAHELARLLARRDLLGTPGPPKKGDPWRTRLKAQVGRWVSARRLTIGAYFRNLLHAYAPSDPWDVGDLHSDVRGRALRLLGDWRPRRPTLILLDDPDPTLTAAVLTTLLGEAILKKRPYRYPVRLLIVNQTIPADVGLRRDSNGWVSIFTGAQEPIALPEEVCFTGNEVKHLAQQVLGRQSVLLGRRDDFDNFMEVTVGNPLLVELGLRWLESRKANGDHRSRPLNTITREGLLRDRAIRIRVALETAQAGDDSLLAIAAATLCGGASRSSLAKQFRNFSPDRLVRAFPLDAPTLAAGDLPPVRPEMIGDEFARTVAGDSIEDARQIVRAAWFAKPEGTLRAVLRLSSGNDRIAEALREGPPAEWIGSRIEVAQAYATHCVQHGTDPASVKREIGFVTPAEAERMLPRLVGLLATPGNDGEAGLACLAYALERAMAEPGGLRAAEDMVSAVRETTQAVKWACQRGLDDSIDRRDLIRAVRHLVARAVAMVGARPAKARADLEDALDALEAVTWGAFALDNVSASISKRLSSMKVKSAEERHRLRSRALAARGRAAEALELTERLLARLATDATATPLLADMLYNSAYALVNSLSPSAAQRAEELAIRLAGLPNVQADRGALLQLARTWQVTGHLWAVGNEAASVKGAERCAQEVESIAGGYADDPEFTKIRMKAWFAVVFALANEPDDAAALRSAALAERIEALAGPFAGDRRIQTIPVEAWSFVTVAHANLAHPDAPQKCLALAKRTDALAQPFRGDSSVVGNTIYAWGAVVDTFIQADRISELEPVVEYIDTLAGRFARRKSIALALATVWANVSSTGPSSVERKRKIAQRIDELAEPHSSDEALAANRLKAWYLVAISLAFLPEGEGIAEAVATAQQLDVIGRSLEGEAPSLLRAYLWRVIGEQLGNLENGVGAAGTAECASRVECISSTLSHHRGLQMERITASQIAAGAYASLPEGVGIVSAKAWAERVESVAARFPDDKEFSLARVRTLTALTVAYSNRQNPADAERAKQSADGVESVAARYAADPEFALHAVVAWLGVTSSVCSAEDGHGVEAAEASATRVDALARPFLDDVKFAERRAQAWGLIAKMYAARGDADGITVAARRMDAIAMDYCGNGAPVLMQVGALSAVVAEYARFPDGQGLAGAKRWIQVLDDCVAPYANDAEFALQHARAWRHLANAYASVGGYPGLEKIEAAAARVDSILRSVVLNPDLAVERILAWRAVVAAKVSLTSGPRIEDAFLLARQLEAWAHPLSKFRAVAVGLADVFTPIIWACANQGTVAVASAEKCVERIGTLLTPFVAHRDAALSQISAWRLLVGAYLNSPSGGFDEHAEAVAHRSQHLASSFEADAIIGSECAEIWYCLVRSVASHDRAAAQRYRAQVLAIARRLPSSRRIQKTLIDIDNTVGVQVSW